MIEEKISKLNCYFEEQIALCNLRGKELLADERTDEATFEKIKANIYDIFHTVFSVAVKNCREDPRQIRLFFVTRIENIPSDWETAYEKAKEHHNAVQMQIEQIKLDTVCKIKENFDRIWEENP